ncbi:MAG: hypothetical protein ACJ8F7_10610 [Gemmataceae bacterium]
MTRETKIGLVVGASFLSLVAGVATVRLMQPQKDVNPVVVADPPKIKFPPDDDSTPPAGGKPDAPPVVTNPPNPEKGQTPDLALPPAVVPDLTPVKPANLILPSPGPIPPGEITLPSAPPAPPKTENKAPELTIPNGSPPQIKIEPTPIPVPTPAAPQLDITPPAPPKLDIGPSKPDTAAAKPPKPEEKDLEPLGKGSTSAPKLDPPGIPKIDVPAPKIDPPAVPKVELPGTLRTDPPKMDVPVLSKMDPPAPPKIEPPAIKTDPPAVPKIEPIPPAPKLNNDPPGLEPPPPFPTQPKTDTAPKSPTIEPAIKPVPEAGGTTATLGTPMPAATIDAHALSGRPDPVAAPTDVRQDSYEEEWYQCQASDTFDTISQRAFNTNKYAQALRMYNRERQSSDNLRDLNPVLRARQTIRIPPARILERYYPSAVPGLPATAPRTSGVPTSLPGGNIPSTPPSDDTPEGEYKVPRSNMTLRDIAKEKLGKSEDWYKIFQLNRWLNPDEPVPVGAMLHMPRR